MTHNFFSPIITVRKATYGGSKIVVSSDFCETLTV